MTAPVKHRAMLLRDEPRLQSILPQGAILCGQEPVDVYLASDYDALAAENERLKNQAARFAATLWDYHKTCPECGNVEGHLPWCAKTYEREFGGPADYMKAFEVMRRAAMAAQAEKG